MLVVLYWPRMLPQDESTAKAPAPRLLVDAMLGRLARWLRLMGYDAVYWRDGSDDALIAAAQAEGRLILTRDHALAGRRGVSALLIEAEALDDQIAAARAALGGDLEPFPVAANAMASWLTCPKLPPEIWCLLTFGKRKPSSAAAPTVVGSTGVAHIGPRWPQD